MDHQDELKTNKTALDRRVPTRWNSEFDCLRAHLEFKPVVQDLTDLRSHKLTAFRLTDGLWSLSEDVCEVLEVCSSNSV